MVGRVTWREGGREGVKEGGREGGRGIGREGGMRNEEANSILISKNFY